MEITNEVRLAVIEELLASARAKVDSTNAEADKATRKSDREFFQTLADNYNIVQSFLEGKYDEARLGVPANPFIG